MEHFNEPWFQPEFTAGPDKVTSLKDAVREHVKPGILLHVGQVGARWCTAILFEVARQFWGRKNSLELVALSMNLPQAVLVHGGIVSKIITSYFGDPYYTPGPNAVFQRSLQDGSLKAEHWSILTLPLRLQAAAMGVPFLPTRSILGSSLERENQDSFAAVDDPFDKERRIGLVKALTPDLSILHAWMADSQGNAVFLPPLSENLYGAMAGRQGVVLSAEKIVPTETIRKYNHLVRLPGTFVRSVSEVPFGAHPGGLSRIGMYDFDVYAEDYDFIDEGRRCEKSEEEFEAWVREWVLSCDSHEAYLEKLGRDRLLRLKGTSHFDIWKFDVRAQKNISRSPSYTPVEMAAVAMSRKLKDTIVRNEYKTMLCGAGISNLAAWLCFYYLRKEGYDIDLIAEVGLYGYVPRPMDPSVFNHRNFCTCKMVCDIQTVMGLILSGSHGSCIGAIGAAEIDPVGNVNSTRTSEGTFITGSGGANDVASTAKEVMVLVGQSKKRFKQHIEYVTSPGNNVRTVVSTLGLFERPRSGEELVLTACFPYYSGKPHATPEEIRERCGWDLKQAPNIEILDPPLQLELDIIRAFDPNRYYLGKKAE